MGHSSSETVDSSAASSEAPSGYRPVPIGSGEVPVYADPKTELSPDG
jgi:hypothetical protein